MDDDTGRNHRVGAVGMFKASMIISGLWCLFLIVIIFMEFGNKITSTKKMMLVSVFSIVVVLFITSNLIYCKVNHVKMIADLASGKIRQIIV